ncbi:MAG TPA: N-acetyltransferase [Kribbella sp.]
MTAEPLSTPSSPRITGAETGADLAAIRDVNLQAFSTSYEAELVDGLRASPTAWLPDLSIVATTASGQVVGHALLTRCHIHDASVLALGPCAVLPVFQRQGVGGAVIPAALEGVSERGENLVVLLGHADYYPRLGFRPASSFGIQAPFEVNDENLMAIVLDESRPVPTGVIHYPDAFGV